MSNLVVFLVYPLVVAVLTLLIEYWVIIPINKRDKKAISKTRERNKSIAQQEKQAESRRADQEEIKTEEYGERDEEESQLFNQATSPLAEEISKLGDEFAEIDRQSSKLSNQEASLLAQEIKRLSSELPRMPNPITSPLSLILGYSIAIAGLSESTYWLAILGTLLFVLGIVMIVRRNRFYREIYKPALIEIEKRKEKLKQLLEGK